MKKFLVVEKKTGLLLTLATSQQVAALLLRGLDSAFVTTIDPGNPFWTAANKTMMAGRNFTVSGRKIVSESQDQFPRASLELKELIKDREEVLNRLVVMVQNWIDEKNNLMFPGMDSTIEFVLRDCEKSNNTFTHEVHMYAEMLGLAPDQAYDELDQMAARMRNLRMRALAFINKYARIINQATDPEGIEKANATMYQDWSEFQST